MAGSQILRGDELHAVQPFWADETQTALAVSSLTADEQQPDSYIRDELDLSSQELKRQLEEVKKAAYAEGLRDGEQGARAEQEQYAQWNTTLAATIEELAGSKARLRQEAAGDLVELSFGIARRILRRELHTDPDALRGIVSAVLERINGADLMKLYTHPAHVPDVERAIAELSPTPVEVIADPSLTHGGLVFETARGKLDGSIDSQLDEIRCGLSDRLGN
jgi:flagellar assembly protein FliH